MEVVVLAVLVVLVVTGRPLVMELALAITPELVVVEAGHRVVMVVLVVVVSSRLNISNSLESLLTEVNFRYS
jgi:hypothetical protein